MNNKCFHCFPLQEAGCCTKGILRLVAPTMVPKRFSTGLLGILEVFTGQVADRKWR